MSSPRFIFNHICLEKDGHWYVYAKKDRRIQKTVDHYGKGHIGDGSTVEDAIDSAVKNGVKRWDIQILKTLKNRD